MTVPFICVLATLLLAYGLKIPVGVAMRLEGHYDNRNPRGQQARLTGWGARMLAAHQNSLEGFPPFAVGVVICNLAHGDPIWELRLAMIYVFARLAYCTAYALDLATLRTIVWFVGFLSTVGLFVLPMMVL